MKLPKRIFIIFAIYSLILLFAFILVNNPIKVIAEESLDDIQSDIKNTQSKIDEISKKIDDLNKGLSSLSGSLSDVLSSIKVIESEITNINNSIGKVEGEINKKSQELEKQVVIRNRTLRNYYKKGPQTIESSILATQLLDSSTTGILASRYLKKYFDTSSEFITSTNLDIEINKKNKQKMEELKKQVEGEMKKLVVIKVATEKKIADQKKVLSEQNSNLGQLSAKLDSLLAQQKAIISGKSGEFSASLSEGSAIDDPKASPNYKPSFSPAFAAFSYGAYTHRNGMSQYGAKGRAESGQDYEEILEYYYKTGVKEEDGLDDKTICIEGGSKKKLGEYLKGLGEMPPSWDEDALKAQVIAARTYAYRYIKAGKCICTSTSCQYYSSALVNRSDRTRWYSAITGTKDKILEGDVTAQYSSTTGGYINKVGWDSKGSWPNGSYELKGGAPWFLKGWYTKDAKISSANCGRSSPWLKQDEMIDILNAYFIIAEGKDSGGILPVTIKSCPVGNKSGDPWDMKKVKEKANDLGYDISSIKSVSVKFSDGGYTSKVIFETNQKTFEIDGQDFASVFNLRAPGYISIRHTPDPEALYTILRK